MTDSERPQDVGRSHKARGKPSPATVALLTRYQEAMRAELAGLLDDLAGAPAPTGLLDADAPPPIMRPSLADRTKLWDLAVRLARELGTEIDPGPTPGATPAKPGRVRKVEY